MGLGSSREISRMSSDSEESGSPLPHGLFQNFGDEENDDLPSIVAYLIRSGQIRFINQNDGDSDSERSSDNEFVQCSQPPMVDSNPDCRNVQKSDLYAHVMLNSGRWYNRRWGHEKQATIPSMMALRQIGFNKQKQFSHGDKCLFNSRYLPNKMKQLASYHHKAFCGTYSEDGNVFLSACQDQHIRIYNTVNNQFELMKSIRARDVGWSVLDTAFSPDGRHAAYSSWSDCVHLCNIYGDHEGHEALYLQPGDQSFCIFSLMFSSDNKEILGGANDGHIYVYDREANKRTLKIDAHDDDVNTVRFADSSSQILYSGGDDGLCKVWDRRTLREERPVPVGTLAGHSDGITYIDTKGDARFFISNSKDQTLKLWDVRYFSTPEDVEQTKRVVATQRWDYRWQQVPRRMSKKKVIKNDSCVMTYKGHRILHTLVRCKFSPEATTGQRYIYTGCATGCVLVYDVLTGKIVRRLEGHNSCVRDVAWHPYENTIISTSWDGTLGKWYYKEPLHTSKSDDEVPMACEDSPRRLRSKGRQVKTPRSFMGLFD